MSETVAENENAIITNNDQIKKKTGRKVLNILFDIFTVLVVLFVIFLLFLMLQMKGLTADGISIAGYRIFLVQTPSMTPAYPSGSVVITRNVSADELNVGDAISFRAYGNTIVTHRIVEIEEYVEGYYRYVTKGDANESNDREKVESGAVLGVVIFGIPNAGHLLNWLRSIWGLFLLVILPAGLVIIGESIKLSGIIREEKQKKKQRENEEKAEALNASGDTDQEVTTPDVDDNFDQELQELKDHRQNSDHEAEANSDLEAGTFSSATDSDSPNNYEVVLPANDDEPMKS